MNLKRRRWAPEEFHNLPPKPLDMDRLARLAADHGVPAVRWVDGRHEWLTKTPEPDAAAAHSGVPARAPMNHKRGTDQ